MKEFILTALASLAGGCVHQVRNGKPMPFVIRVGHIFAGALCAIYLSPLIIEYLRLSGDTAYLVPFLCGAFWNVAYDRVEAFIKSLPLPTIGGKK